MIPLWFREIFFSLAKRFFLLLHIIYILFFLMDFATEGIVFLKKAPSISDLLSYFFHQAILYADFLLPLCFLLSLISTLLQKTNNLELCALQTAGISTVKIFLPFFLFSLGVVFSSFLLSECIYPISAKNFYQLEKTYKKSKERSLVKISLPDRSTILAKEKKKDALEDLFWIRNGKEIWHIRKIEKSEPLRGTFVHKFYKEKNKIHLSDMAESLVLPFSWDEIYSLPDKNTLSLSELYNVLSSYPLTPDEKTQFALLFHEKWLRPLFSFLSLLFFPICCTFHRNRKSLLVYLSSLFLFVSMHMLEGAISILILGKVLSPGFLWIPFLLGGIAGFFLLILKSKKIFATKKEHLTLS